MSGKKKVSKHPRLYTIFKPNELIKAKKDMNLMENKVYNEILNNNHFEQKDQLEYKVPYEYVIDITDHKNRKTNIRRIGDNLQKRVFYFDRSFMFEHFGQDAESSLVPFPQISYYKDHFVVRLDVVFKRILTLIKEGFTKGDIETLRLLNHEISNTLYWQIRQVQTWHGTWEVELDDLKNLLGLTGKYKDYNNFKRKVLEIAYVEFKDTWVEFEYEPIKRGQGAAVKALRFKFKNGPKQEKDAPAGEEFIWEEKLLRFGVSPDKIKEIRQRVRIQQQSECDFIWDTEYVRFSLEAMTIEIEEKKKSPKKNQIRNIGAWIYNGLMTGQWLLYVNNRKEKIVKEVQQTLSFTNEKTEAGAGKNKLIENVAQIEAEWKEIWIDSKSNSTQTFEDFMAKNNMVKEGLAWVKIK